MCVPTQNYTEQSISAHPKHGSSFTSALCQKSQQGKKRKCVRTWWFCMTSLNVSVGTSSAFTQVVWFKGENPIAFVPFWSQDLRKWLSSYNYFLKYRHNISSWARSFSWLPWHNSHQICGRWLPIVSQCQIFQLHCSFSPVRRGWQWGKFWAERLNPWHRLDILAYWLLL